MPVAVYRALKDDIESKVAKLKKRSAKDSDYVPFVLEDYVDNPASVARIKAGLSQAELAERMDVSQAYISKVEGQDDVSVKLLQRVTKAVKP